MGINNLDISVSIFNENIDISLSIFSIKQIEGYKYNINIIFIIPRKELYGYTAAQEIRSGCLNVGNVDMS